MRTIVAISGAFLASALISGCSTVCNLCLDPHGNPDIPTNPIGPYGGAVRCAEGIRLWATEAPVPLPGRILGIAVGVCDLPLSAAADTLLLPYTVPYALMHHEAAPAAPTLLPNEILAFERIRLGMSQREVINAIGAEPGYYDTKHPRFGLGGAPTGRQIRDTGLTPSNGDETVKRWVWNDYWLLVAFGTDNTVIGCSLYKTDD